METVKIILIIIGIIIAISIYKNGFEAWKGDFFKKTIDTGSDVGGKLIDVGKTIIDKNKDTVVPQGINYVGKPVMETNCLIDSDCVNHIENCNDCKCDINTGQCYLV